ncbi:MAG: hypothetical protein IJT95_01740, partial [Abditibacteriota bacterium]|nr:hypothetical protein [Abditibacteriota bacterium]
KKRRGCRGCLIAVWVIVFIFIGFSIYVTRLPFYKPYEKCSRNCINSVLPAMERYYNKNSAYPESLRELQGEYLKDKSTIYCPLDDQEHEYEYYRPESPDYQGVVLRCTRHRIFGKKTELGFTLTGKIKARVSEEERAK